VPLREALRWVARNRIQDGMTLASLLLAESYLKRGDR
jgi:hypothetical protein